MNPDLCEQCRPVAERFVTAGRVVPGLTVGEGGRARSWWWPLPSADDRAVIGGLLAAEGRHGRDGQEEVAQALQEIVDAEARRRLVQAGVQLVAPRRVRRAATDAWLHSLTSEDPWLPESVPTHDVAALAAQVQAWVRSGLPAAGPTRLCLRIHEPADAAPDASRRQGRRRPLASGAAPASHRRSEPDRPGSDRLGGRPAAALRRWRGRTRRAAAHRSRSRGAGGAGAGAVARPGPAGGAGAGLGRGDPPDRGGGRPVGRRRHRPPPADVVDPPGPARAAGPGLDPQADLDRRDGGAVAWAWTPSSTSNGRRRSARRG